MGLSPAALTDPALADGAGPGRAQPGLLAWQIVFLAYGLGLLGPRFPLPAGICLGLAWVLAVLLRPRLGPFAGREPGADVSSGSPLSKTALRSLGLPLGMALAFGLGWGWAAWRMPPLPDRVPDFLLHREKVAATARVAGVEPRPGGRVQVLLEDVRVTRPDGGQEALPGRTVWNWDEAPAWPEPGQEVSAVFRFRPVRDFRNPGQADFELYWRCRGVFWRVYSRGDPGDLVLGPPPGAFAWELRLRLRRALVGGMDPGPGAALVLAQLLGDYSLLDEPTTAMMRRAGLSHTLALSGMNVGYVVFFGWLLALGLGAAWPGLLLRLPRPKLTVLLSAPLVLGFLWIGQFSGSLLRATVMFGAFALHLFLDRRQFLLDGLFLALAAILLVSPLSVHDMGLELSSLSVAGIILFLPALRRLHLAGEGMGVRAANGLLDLAGLSLAANVSLLPLLAWHFGEVNPNFLVNLPWLPLLGFVVMPLALAGLGLVALADLVPVFPAGPGTFLLDLAARVMDGMLSGLARVDGLGLLPVFSVYRPRWFEMAGYGVLLASLAALAAGRGGVSRGTAPSGRGAVLGLALGLGLLVLPSLGQGLARGLSADLAVEVGVLDVGQGQSVCVTAPDGGRFLVDCGGSGGPRFDIGQAVVGQYLTLGRAPRLAGAALSHEDADHAQGFGFLLDRFRVERFLFNGIWPHGPGGGPPDRRVPEGPGLEILARERGVDVRTVRAGDRADLGNGLVLHVLHPDRGPEAEEAHPGARAARPNDRSLVLRLVWRGRGLALFPGDLSARSLRDLLAQDRDLSADLLLVPHHGSKGSLSPELYARVAPRLAVASSGFLNAFGFPHPEVAAALARQGVPLATTADLGMVRAVWRAVRDAAQGPEGPQVHHYKEGRWSPWPLERAGE